MTQRRRNYKKLIWWGAGVILVVLVVVGVVIGVNNNSNCTNESGDDNSEKVEQMSGSEQSEKTEAEKQDEAVASQQTPAQYEGDNPNVAETLSGVVTYTGVNDGVLMIRISIDQYLTEGICELTLTRGGAIIYSDTTNIMGDVSTATCQGFDVATAGLGEGNLEIIVNLNADGKSGVIRGEASI